MLDTMNWVDVILGGAVIISALVGLMRGFIKEVLSLIAWFVALYVAWHFSEMIAENYIRQFIVDDLISYLAAFGGLFLLTLFAIGLVNLLVAQLFNVTGLGGFDRLLGMLFGLARGALISALIVFFASFTPLVQETWWQSSTLVPGFSNLAQWGMSFLPREISELLDRQANPPVELEVEKPTDENTLGQHFSADSEGIIPTRPQIDENTRHHQSVQNNAISEIGNSQGLTLESIEETPQEDGQSTSGIILESTQ